MPAVFPKKPFTLSTWPTPTSHSAPPPQPHPNQLLPSWERCKHLKGRGGSLSLCPLWARYDPQEPSDSAWLIDA